MWAGLGYIPWMAIWYQFQEFDHARSQRRSNGGMWVAREGGSSKVDHQERRGRVGMITWPSDDGDLQLSFGMTVSFSNSTDELRAAYFPQNLLAILQPICQLSGSRFHAQYMYSLY
jgi:hypothetical protein